MSYPIYGDIFPLTSRDKSRLGALSPAIYTLGMRTFREALLAAVEESGMSLRALADGAGVSYEQLKKLKQNKSKSTNVDDAAKLARYLGVPLSDLLAGVASPVDAETVEILSQLTEQERRFLLNAARAQIADRQPPKPE
jgi:transcriptional regulator with XRE-family HTH domain